MKYKYNWYVQNLQESKGTRMICFLLISVLCLCGWSFNHVLKNVIYNESFISGGAMIGLKLGYALLILFIPAGIFLHQP